MADTTTRPRVRTGATKAAAARPTAEPKPEPKPEPTDIADTTKRRVTLELEPLEPTKSYAKFTPPAGSGCVGTFYAPLGTETVKVLLVSPAE